MRRAKGRQKPVAPRLWETPSVDVDLSLQFGCGVSRDGNFTLRSANVNFAIAHLKMNFTMRH
jgi:hypothetical protein